MVIINRCVPVKFKLGNFLMQLEIYVFFVKGMPSYAQRTNCPMCNQHVKPVLCAFNNFSWRYLGFMETKNGNERVKCDWRMSGDHYERFEESSQLNWASLVIETHMGEKLRTGFMNLESMTKPLKCGICLDFSLHEGKKCSYTLDPSPTIEI